MKKLLLIIFTVCCSLSVVVSQTSETDKLDRQFWHETQLSFPLIKTTNNAGKTTDKLSVFFNGNLRAGSRLSYPFEQRIGFGFDYKYNKYVSIVPSYLYIAQQSAKDSKQYESRLRFAVSIRNSWRKFSLEDRNLVEYRFRNNKSDSVRYRNRLRFLYPVKRNDKELFTPFAANEVFYDFQTKTFSRNELSFGLSRKLSSTATADFFYLLQINKNGAPKHLNVFGVNLKINLD